MLVQGERHVEELAGSIGQSVANTSFHLRVLATAGLVTTRREGTRIYDRIASDRVAELWAALWDVAAPTTTASTSSPRTRRPHRLAQTIEY